LVVVKRHFNNALGCPVEQLEAVDVRCHHRTVARQRKTNSLVEAVHGVRRKHTRTRATGGASTALNLLQNLVAHAVVCAHNHNINQVVTLVAKHPCLHRSARNEYGGNVEAHGSHQHTRGNLVAAADAHQRINAVGVAHVLHAVGNEVARGQRVQHTAMPHGNTVINGNGVELGSKAAALFNFGFHALPDLVQVHMPGYKLRKRVSYGDNGLAHLLGLHAVG